MASDGPGPKLLRQGFDVRMKVTGSSMALTLENGSTVILRPIRRIHIGNIVFYRTGMGHAVLHRVVLIVGNSKEKQMFFTMGDALCTMEGPFSTNAVMGRAVIIEPIGASHPIDLTSFTAHLKARRLRLRLALASTRKLTRAIIRWASITG